MKKRTLIALCALAFLSLGSIAQNPAAGQKPAQKQLSFTSAEAKQQRIQELERLVKVNTLDKTYPAADLAAQKKELELVRKAKIKSTSTQN